MMLPATSPAEESESMRGAFRGETGTQARKAVSVEKRHRRLAYPRCDMRPTVVKRLHVLATQKETWGWGRTGRTERTVTRRVLDGATRIGRALLGKADNRPGNRIVTPAGRGCVTVPTAVSVGHSTPVRQRPVPVIRAAARHSLSPQSPAQTSRATAGPTSTGRGACQRARAPPGNF